MIEFQPTDEDDVSRETLKIPQLTLAEIAKEQLANSLKFHDHALEFYQKIIDELIDKLKEHKFELARRTDVLKAASVDHYGYVGEVIELTQRGTKVLEDRINGHTPTSPAAPAGG